MIQCLQAATVFLSMLLWCLGCRINVWLQWIPKAAVVVCCGGAVMAAGGDAAGVPPLTPAQLAKAAEMLAAALPDGGKELFKAVNAAGAAHEWGWRGVGARIKLHSSTQ